MGLDAASIGSALIHRAARLRMKSLGLKRVDLYRELLRSSPGEWDELMESVVVTESWFFRDRETFTALVSLVLRTWLPEHPTAPLRLLSLPCSSGEEPYSMAMALQDAGISNGRFLIDAADISGRALARARQGIYRKNSFRNEDLAFRDRHFLAGSEGFLLKAAIRERVNFYQGNVLAEDFLADRGRYDFIFCRNLLIYFDRPTQEKALRRIERLLSPSGTLFVGPAELPLVLDHGFVSAGIPMAFACQKAAAAASSLNRRQGASKAPNPARVVTGPWNLNEDSPGKLTDTGHFEIGKRAVGARATGSADLTTPGNGTLKGGHQTLAAATLDTARRYANAGRLKEAAGICENHLREYGSSAEAYYLLGLVLDAQSNPKAIDCYRKALYLEPDHYETLLQMASLSQRNGDAVRADSLKRRALRITLRSGGEAERLN